ncbi:MAG: hypothetical protein RQ847_03790 [Wenzhouxiangellaceae bacterium]|nr:hypothetical protein [Wenzhouxiangellaceae bacterium]
MRRKYPAEATALALIALISLPLAAQQEGQQDHGSQFFNPYPESGRWFADDGSRTGFFIEVQNGILAGLYVGADGDGENVWLNFSGRLEPSFENDVQAGWRLQSDLVRIRGGGCILFCGDGPPRLLPIVLEAVGEIEIVFHGRSRAEFAVDGGDFTPIRPITFGVVADGGLPDLSGRWVVAISDARRFPDHSAATLVALSEPETEVLPVLAAPPPGAPTRIVRHRIIEDEDDLFPANSRIECTFRIGAESVGLENPTCEIAFPGESNFGFTLQTAWISDSTMTMLRTNSTGSIARLQMFRLNHD